MNINASIIDQQVRALAIRRKDDLTHLLPGAAGDHSLLHSLAFVLLGVKTLLDISEEEALDCITEGGNDFGIDAIAIGDVQDCEFTVTLFQGKYKNDLEGNNDFPQTGVEKMLQAVGVLFDSSKTVTLNKALQAQVEEVRSLIGEGNLPQVRVIFCNNGKKWTRDTEKIITIALVRYGNQVRIEHINHDSLVAILQSAKPVNGELHLIGKAIVEAFDFSRVLVGKVPISEIKTLFDHHGDRLLERNIRRYLGLRGNRVNEAIATTLRSQQERNNFYFYNNGITIVCRQFQYNALQDEHWQVRLTGLQIINGGQTCKTIQEVLSDPSVSPDRACVLIRVYELPGGKSDLIRTITYATNSQNPVDLRNFRSNDAIQRALAQSIKALNYEYHRQRSADSVMKSTDITSAVAAAAVFSVWRRRPHQAKFRSTELFGKFYDLIFTDKINGAQVIVAVLLFRIAENRRKRPHQGDPESVRYASCFYAMLMGVYLLRDLDIEMNQLDHRNFSKAQKGIEEQGESYLEKAIGEIEAALEHLYGDAGGLSLQRLSATFRREDLIEKLPKISLS